MFTIKYNINKVTKDILTAYSSNKNDDIEKMHNTINGAKSIKEERFDIKYIIPQEALIDEKVAAISKNAEIANQQKQIAELNKKLEGTKEERQHKQNRNKAKQVKSKKVPQFKWS